MKFPDFIIAGCMKCGTTSLFLNLSKHPDITMSTRVGPIKERTMGTEMYYWTTKLEKTKSLDWYKRRFAGKVSGEKSPGYWAHPGALSNIYKNNPNTKLIISLRHPVERAFSHYSMFVRRKTNPKPCTLELIPKNYLRLSRYYELLTNITFKVFDRKNVHFVISDWMKENPSKEIMKIHKFLGIKPINLPPKEIDWSKKKRMVYKISKEQSYIFFSKYSKNRLLPNERKKFLKYFKSHNEKLFDFLGFRISEWEI